MDRRHIVPKAQPNGQPKIGAKNYVDFYEI